MLPCLSRRNVPGILLLALVAAGCATTTPPPTAVADAAPGITASERQALTAGFQVRPDQPVPAYTPAQLDALMRRSNDASLMGDAAEGQVMALAVALTSAGDDAFADALLRQTANGRDAVNSGALRSLWTRYGLRYPRTQALLPGA